VIGLPTSGIRTGEYARDIAPEMLSGFPYCPFRADIWQLGTMFKAYFGVCHIMLLNHFSEQCIFQHLGNLSQPLIELFDTMSAKQPGSHPLASAALRHVQQIQLALSVEALLSAVPYLPYQMERLAVDNAKPDAEIEA
jgi:hypothetical protein